MTLTDEQIHDLEHRIEHASNHSLEHGLGDHSLTIKEIKDRTSRRVGAAVKAFIAALPLILFVLLAGCSTPPKVPKALIPQCYVGMQNVDAMEQVPTGYGLSSYVNFLWPLPGDFSLQVEPIIPIGKSYGEKSLLRVAIDRRIW